MNKLLNLTRSVNINLIKPTIISLITLVFGGFFFFFNTATYAQSTETSTDLNIKVTPSINLSLTNCPGLPDANSNSITLNVSPKSSGTFKSNCQDINVQTNTAGYQLLTKVSNTNLTHTTSTANPKPTIPSTSNTFSSPNTIANDTWGYAVANLGSFDTTYTVDNANNKYAKLNTTDTQIYNETDSWPLTRTAFKFFYSTRLSLKTNAGSYKTTITYTAVGSEPEAVPLKFKEVSVGGGRHTCAIATNDNAYCWGRNSSGELGNGTNDDSNVPVKVDNTGVLSGLTIKQISAGYGLTHTCAIASDDNAYCWGGNSNGQLGNGNTGGSSNVPVLVSKISDNQGGYLTIKQIIVGSSKTCAIASDDNAYCWGNGRLGDGNNTSSNVPVKVDNTGALSGLTVKQITNQNRGACVIASDDNAYCWGDGQSGDLGDGTTGTSNVPVKVVNDGVLNGLTVKQISGHGPFCVIASDDNAYCWGYGLRGELGNGGNEYSNSTPVKVVNTGALNGLTIKQISTSSHTCVIASDDNAYCWGLRGGLGDGNDNDNTNVPVKVVNTGALNGLTIKQISSDGDSHTCVIASDDNAYCWGYNHSGQLGNGSTGGTSSVPVKVINPTL